MTYYFCDSLAWSALWLLVGYGLGRLERRSIHKPRERK